jgi:hypothetical protein
MSAFSNSPLDLFFELSKELCGMDDLSKKLSEVYYGIFHNDPAVSGKLKSLLATYQPGSLQELINNDTDMKDLALDIIKLWYLGVIKSLEVSTAPMPLMGGGFYFYQEALIWKAAQAHPAGLSGGYYGYWSYKPEN